MSKINKLTLSNFKFFREAQTIDLGGKHLLLYGENGSGKSTIFWGLYTLLEASNKRATDIEKYFKSRDINDESLVNIYAIKDVCPITGKEHFNSYIKVQDDQGVEKQISALDYVACSDPIIKESRRATGFIDYKALFKFHDFKNSEIPDLYNIFNYTVLPYVDFEAYTNSDKKDISNAFEMWQIYKNGLEPLYSRTSYVDEVIETSEYKDFEVNANRFTDGINILIEYINKSAVKILEALGYKFKFELILTPPTSSYLLKVIIDEKDESLESAYQKEDEEEDEHAVKMIISRAYAENANYKIGLIITEYNGKTVNINKPQTFLNEAKMSAVAIAIRLSILEKQISSTVAPDAIKALVLDDVMISLDMSNRDKLSEYIIKNYSDKYQILMMTHNAELFDFMKIKINMYKSHPFLLNKETYDNWIVKEMYCGEKDGVDVPVIIDSTLGNYDKATKYFQAHNYEVAAIYLRKGIEEVVQKALPSDRVYSVDRQVYPLGTLWTAFVELHINKETAEGKKIFELFELSKAVLLNPAAHYQRNSKHIFKCELEKGFELYKKMTSTQYKTIKTIFKKDTVFTFVKDKLIVEFQLKQGLCTETDSSGVDFNNAKCKILKFEYDGILDYDFNTSATNPRHRFKNSNPEFKEFVIKINPHLGTSNTSKDEFFNNLSVDGEPISASVDYDTFMICVK